MLIIIVLLLLLLLIIITPIVYIGPADCNHCNRNITAFCSVILVIFNDSWYRFLYSL